MSVAANLDVQGAGMMSYNYVLNYKYTNIRSKSLFKSPASGGAFITLALLYLNRVFLRAFCGFYVELCLYFGSRGAHNACGFKELASYLCTPLRTSAFPDLVPIS